MSVRKTIDLGKNPNGRKFTLPVELAGRRSFVCGMSGYGKSNTATVCVEGLVRAGEQCILIDPKGEGWGLQSSSDGNSEGLDVIVFGEPRGDIEDLNESHGERLADFAVDTGRSIVLSLLGFDSDASERRFVTAFFKRLFRKKSKQETRTRTLVVVDEAHLFVPESSGSGHKGDLATMVGAIQRCVRQGRSYGLGSMLVDQRPQDVSKRLVSQSELLVIHSLSHTRDRKALKEWTDGYGESEQQAQLLDTLAVLESGESWVWSPSWLKTFERVRVNRRTTFDSGSNPDGSAESLPAVRTSVDLDSLRGELDEVVREAEANDPKTLKATISDLKRRLHAKPVSVIDEAAMSTAVSLALVDRDREWKERLKPLRVELQELKTRLDRINALSVRSDDSIEINEPEAPDVPKPNGRPPRHTTPSQADGVDLTRYQIDLLKALIDRYPIPMSRGTLAVFSGKSSKSSSFDDAIRVLRKGDLLVSRGREYLATDRALSALPGYSPAPPKGKAAADYWKNRLKRYEADLFTFILSNYPTPATKDEISAGTGKSMTSSSFDDALRTLVKAHLVFKIDGGYVAADLFFEQ